MEAFIDKIIDILDKNKYIIKELFIDMIKKKQECQNMGLSGYQIETRAKIIFVSMICFLCNIKKANYTTKVYSDIVFYRKIFYYIFSNIACTKSNKSIVKTVYILLNNIKREYEKNIIGSSYSNHSDESSVSSMNLHNATVTTCCKVSETPETLFTNNNSNLDMEHKDMHVLVPKMPCEEVIVDDIVKLEDSYKVLGLLKILLVMLERDTVALQNQINLEDPNGTVQSSNVDYLNRLINIFFSQFFTIICKYRDLFNKKTNDINTFKIVVNNQVLTVCELDNLDIMEDMVDGCKIVVINIGKQVLIINYGKQDVTNDIFNEVLTQNLGALSVLISIVVTNCKILESSLAKIKCLLNK